MINPDIKTSEKIRTQLSIKRNIKRNVIGYIFVLPVLLGILLFNIGPMLYSMYISFTIYDNLTPPTFVGIQNYITVFKEARFLNSLAVTFEYALFSVVLGLIFSFFIAILLNSKIKGMTIYRTILYTPVIIPAVVASFVWVKVFGVPYGYINLFLNRLGIEPFPFLTSPDTAIGSLLMFSLWGIGGSMLIWLAGLKNVPHIYYEAAEIDGVGWWGKFVHITLPLVSPVIFYNLIMGIIGGLQSFTQTFLMTNGGPRESTNFLVFNIFTEGFKNLEMGKASAQAWILFVIILALTGIVFATSKWVFYGEE